MSGSNGATYLAGGNTVDTGNAANLVAIQGPNTHVGTPSVSFPFSYGGSVLNLLANEPFIADAKLYAALNASAQASANIAWTN